MTYKPHTLESHDPEKDNPKEDGWYPCLYVDDENKKHFDFFRFYDGCWLGAVPTIWYCTHQESVEQIERKAFEAGEESKYGQIEVDYNDSPYIEYKYEYTFDQWKNK